MKALHILKTVLKDTIMSREKEYISEAIKELEELENRSCENCKTISKCSILRKVVKDRLRKDGYLMSQKEFDCRFWEPKK
jgi:hypothetical protein